MDKNYSDKDLDLAMNRTKIKLMTSLNTAFITTVLFSQELVYTTDVPTAGVDGFSLFINPDYFMSLTEAERLGVLFHEPWHICWNHMARGRDFDQEKYNKAGDYVINNMGTKLGYVFPEGALIDAQYNDMSTFEVYKLLPDKPKSPGGGSPVVKGFGGGDVIYDKQQDPQKTKEKQEHIDTILRQAIQAAEMDNQDPGSIPADLQVYIEKLRAPVLPWSSILQNFMTDYAQSDYSYRRANKKFMPDFILPTLYSENLGHIAVGVDSSGSVSNADFTAFLSELEDIKERLQPDLMTIIDFDTKIKQIHHIEKENSLSTIKFHGRGGTNINELWNWGKDNNPLVLIIFSDMFFTHPTMPLDCPVIWICVNNSRHPEMPYGDTIYMDTP